MLVTNYNIECLDSKQHCAALFVDLSKALDSVDLVVWVLVKQL